METMREAELYEAVADEFGWLTVDQTFARCGVSTPSGSYDLMRSMHLSKWELWVDSDAGPLHPGFFLRESDEFGFVVAEAPEAALHFMRTVSPACSVWQVIEWLLTPLERLDGRRPVDVEDHGSWATIRTLLGQPAPPSMVSWV